MKPHPPPNPAAAAAVSADPSPADDTGPLVRLDVSEWSVEYDELLVTVWASTSSADYKLLSAAPIYRQFWQTLQRKTVRLRRARTRWPQGRPRPSRSPLSSRRRCPRPR